MEPSVFLPTDGNGDAPGASQFADRQMRGCSKAVCVLLLSALLLSERDSVLRKPCSDRFCSPGWQKQERRSDMVCRDALLATVAGGVGWFLSVTRECIHENKRGHVMGWRHVSKSGYLTRLHSAFRYLWPHPGHHLRRLRLLRLPRLPRLRALGLGRLNSRAARSHLGAPHSLVAFGKSLFFGL